MIKVGIIGSGIIGTRLKNRFLKEENVEILYFCDTDIEKARLLSVNTNAKITAKYDDVINDPEVDLVYIGVPPKWHKEMAVEALKLDKHVICEKPIAYNTIEAKEMVEAEKHTSKLTCVNLPFRWTPAVNEFKKQLELGFVGTIKKIILRFRFPDWPRSWQQTEWLKYKDQGGGLREVGTHFFFALYEFSPWIGKVQRVWAVTEYGKNDLAEWNSNGLLEFTSGLTATLDYLTGSAEKEENSITVMGDKGYLTLQNWSILLGSQNGGELIELKNGWAGEEDMVAGVMKTLTSQKPENQLVSFEEATYAQMILQAIHESGGNWITLDS
jgi:predicted dehydrogenase